MRAFTAKGTLYIPTPERVIKPQKKAIIIKECFYPEGHNLISSRFSFDGHNGILLKVRHGKNTGLIALSPIQDTAKIINRQEYLDDCSNTSSSIDFKNNLLVNIDIGSFYTL
ncbi:MAG: hypothetical protein WC865_00275 [Bacteroidales bacterium]